MKRITAQMLKERGACASEVQRFRKVFPVGAPVSMRSLVRAQKAGLDVFFAECFLAGPAMAEYQKLLALDSVNPYAYILLGDLAERMGAHGFTYASPEEIMREINRLTPSYGGITYSRIEDNGLQWPCPDPNHPGTPCLHQGKFSRPGDKACFSPLAYRPPAETADGKYPLILTTDRSLFHFHSSTMTRRVPGLSSLDANEWLCIHPADAERYGIADGAWVEVSSRRGAVKVQALLTDVCQPGLCSMTFHFHESPTNLITNPALDPVAKIPETKVTAVSVRPILETAG